MVKRFETVAIAAASYNLTDLASAKDELAIPTATTMHDAFLTRKISQASIAIATYCARVFAVERLVETFYFIDDDSNMNIDSSPAPLQVSRFPVVRIASLTENGIALVEGTDFVVDQATGQINRLNCIGSGMRRWYCGPVVVTYDGGLGKTVTQNSSLPLSAGPYTITVANAATWALDVSVTRDDGTVFTAVTGTPAAGQYKVAAGVYTFNAANAGETFAIAYDYTATPADLSQAALKLVVMWFRSKSRDPMQVSHAEPGIGEDRWFVGGVPNQAGPFPPDIEGLVAPYRDCTF